MKMLTNADENQA